VFGRRFSHDPELVYFWRLYAEAERYHGATLRLHRAAFVPELDTSALPAGHDDLRALLAEVRGLRERWERTAPSLGEALDAAQRIEETTAEVHGRTQFFRGLPGYEDVLEKMVEEDRAHREVLAAAHARFLRTDSSASRSV
jgi:hypothetical protein